jgi:putative toxin-antitoxin system antitoxin component (TIGR02293 family)
MGLSSAKPFNEVKNVNDFIDCIREGVPKHALDNLLSVTGITVNEITNIIRTSDRTLRRYTSKQKLNAEQSERVIELAKLYSRGEEVFGSLDAFKEWMNSTVMALGNKKPKDFLDTSLGIEMLMDELGRIEQGIFA